MKDGIPRKIVFEVDKLPPSVNHYYIHSHRGVFLTSKAREYRKMIEAIALTKIQEPMIGPVKVSVLFSLGDRRRHDIDNLLKLLMDSGNKIIWNDDSQIQEINASKKFIGVEGVKIEVEEICEH